MSDDELDDLFKVYQQDESKPIDLKTGYRNLTYPMRILREVAEYVVCYSPGELNEVKSVCIQVSKAIADHRSKEANATWLLLCDWEPGDDRPKV